MTKRDQLRTLISSTVERWNAVAAAGKTIANDLAMGKVGDGRLNNALAWLDHGATVKVVLRSRPGHGLIDLEVYRGAMSLSVAISELTKILTMLEDAVPAPTTEKAIMDDRLRKIGEMRRELDRLEADVRRGRRPLFHLLRQMVDKMQF